MDNTSSSSASSFHSCNSNNSSTMAERDPFPMASKEAQDLADSVGGGQGQWGSMKTESAGRGPRDNTANSGDTASSKLVEGGNAGGGVTDYMHDEDDEEPNNKDDDFLDRPLDELRNKSPLERMVLNCLRTLESVYKQLYGDKLPPSEMLRTLCLALTLFFMIGGYWLLRSLKDTVMIIICGVQYIPQAKIMSVFIVLGVVSVYNMLLDSSIPKHQLFYYFGTFYLGLFTFIGMCLMNDSIGLNSDQEASPNRLLGWISYCGIESFGSVMVSLFWSFANSTFSLETAKASYGVMVATAQVGSILGPTVVNMLTSQLGIAKIYLIGALCMLLLQGTMYMYISIYGTSGNQSSSSGGGDGKKKEKAGVLEGLILFWKYNYVKGIFAISCLFMVEVTIVDYTMKVLATDYFTELHPCTEGMSCWIVDPIDGTGKPGISEQASTGMAEFMGFFGQATNTLSFLLSFLGTSAIIRYLGFKTTLLLFPTLCLGIICMVRLRPTLYVVFGAMITLKACSYGLNNPTKEILYQPTNSAVRYKAKSWIDIFGARGSKALGSVITNAFSDSTASLVSNGSLVGMLVASFLIWNARYMGNLFDLYTNSGYIVGNSQDYETYMRHAQAAGGSSGGGEVEDGHVELGEKQNENEDTSCAIYEDDQVGEEEEGQSESNDGDEDDDDDDDDENKDEGDDKRPAVVARV